MCLPLSLMYAIKTVKDKSSKIMNKFIDFMDSSVLILPDVEIL